MLRVPNENSNTFPTTTPTLAKVSHEEIFEQVCNKLVLQSLLWASIESLGVLLNPDLSLFLGKVFVDTLPSFTLLLRSIIGSAAMAFFIVFPDCGIVWAFVVDSIRTGLNTGMDFVIPQIKCHTILRDVLCVDVLRPFLIDSYSVTRLTKVRVLWIAQIQMTE